MNWTRSHRKGKVLAGGEDVAPVSDSTLEKEDAADATEMDSLASSVQVLAGDENAAPVSDSALDKKDPGGAPEAQAVEWNTKYPRIDLPEIEQQPGQAIREDTPGHIEQAFPKLCPHGTVERKTKYPKTGSKKQIQCGPNGPMAKWWYEEFPFCH